jgi:metallophosphoesterase superfamily enzyme
VHGHKWPHEDLLEDLVLIHAHNHPTVTLIDELDVVHNYSCWVRGRCVKDRIKDHYGDDFNPVLHEIILIPSFQEHGSGTPVNEKDQQLLGPFLKNGILDLENSNVYLLDGTFLGTVDRLILD